MVTTADFCNTKEVVVTSRRHILQEVIGDVTAQNHRSYDNQITSEDHPTSVIMMMDLVMHISSMVVF